VLPAGGYEPKIMSDSCIGPIDESGLDQVVNRIVITSPFPHVISFTGDLGAGKTTLIRKLLQAMDCPDTVSSPTFGIVNEYYTTSGTLICHTDWYRMKDAGELVDTGILEYLHNDDCLMLVEWPQIGAALLDEEQCLHINITHDGDKRSYLFSDCLS
jgi:tRNA threonylcarbamoyladenosine biosynthesis protein TsaE